MKQFFIRNKFIIIGSITVIALITFGISSRDTTPDWVTETVTRGTVEQIVSVSGVMKAADVAYLGFPVSGTVADIRVREGEYVTPGQILATLEQGQLQAELRDAEGALMIAQANDNELKDGPRDEERTVTELTVDIARSDLLRTTREETERVQNAYRTLLTSDLEAVPEDPDTDDIPPVIGGTYTCAREGTYRISIFASSARSGYSYRLDGLEQGTFTAYTEAAAALGSCGLTIQFDNTESYANKTWIVSIPNRNSASYITNWNAYTIAEQRAKNLIDAAEQDLNKAEADALLANADPRKEETDRSTAAVIQAEARRAAIYARIQDRTLRAPFAGIVSAITIVPGEVPQGGAITLVAESLYELTIRIPEIDITHIRVGQPAEVYFDARPDEVITSSIAFIAEDATEIDGVAYFEAKLHFSNPPEWFRSGLNADVNIIIEEQSDVLRLPKRFVTKDGAGNYTVLIPDQEETRTVPVTVTFTGNDGYYAIAGLEEGTSVIAP